MVTPNVFTYWNGGYTQTRFDQINLFDPDGDGTPFGSIGSHTYHGWFIGGGTEIALSGLFGLPLPSGLFWRSEYRYSSFSGADLPVLDPAGFQLGFEHMKPVARQSPPPWSGSSTGWDTTSLTNCFVRPGGPNPPGFFYSWPNLAAAVEFGRDCQIIGITGGPPSALTSPTVQPRRILSRVSSILGITVVAP